MGKGAISDFAKTWSVTRAGGALRAQFIWGLWLTNMRNGQQKEFL